MPRKPIPTAIKKARGNPGHRTLPKDEPQPVEASDSDMPARLSADARRCWHAIAKVLRDAQVLSVMDVPVLSRYCESFAQYEKAQRELKKKGEVIRGAVGPRLNPWLRVRRMAHEEMLKIELEYGMTPAARTRVRVVPPSAASGGGQQSSQRAAGNVFSLIQGAKQAR